MASEPKIDIETEAPDEAQPRQLVGIWRQVATVLCLLAGGFTIYTGAMGPLPDIRQRAVFIGVLGTLGLLLYPAGRRSSRNRPSWLDALLALLVLITCTYAVLNYSRLIQVATIATTVDLVMAGVLTLVMMELGRRTIGSIMVGVALVLLAYAYFGPYFPGTWAHRAVSLNSVLEALYFGTNGLWGSVTAIVATTVAMFIVFGAIILNTGGGDTFVDISLWIAGRYTGGAGKVASLGSALFGMVSGSAAANAATTGNFSIPMMKRMGYPSSLAAAIEAVAATGGQMMPPIMGAGAFIMSELINMPYRQIALAATIPAILYYVGVVAAVHFEAKKRKLGNVPRELIPAPSVFLPWRRSGPLLVPVVLLLGMVIYGYTPTTAAFWAILAGVILFFASSRSGAELKQRAMAIFRAIESSGRAMVMLAALAALAQVIIAMIGLSGLGIKLSHLLISMSGGHLFLALVLTALLCSVLGMGITTTADYVLAASVIGPALTSLGLSPLAAHMFIFYWASSSALTPPVAAAVFVTAGIAGSDPWKTGWLACRIGIAAFVAPFIFAYAPGLILQGNWWQILVPSVTALVGIVVASIVFANHWLAPLRWWERALLAVASLGLMWPALWPGIGGAVVCVAIYLLQRRTVRNGAGTPILAS